MSKSTSSGNKVNPLLGKIALFSSFLDSLEISDRFFKESGLNLPIFDKTEIRIRCFKCCQRRYKTQPRVYKHCRGLLTHLYSPDHKIDPTEFPTLAQSVKMVYLVSFMVQQKYLGVRV